MKPTEHHATRPHCDPSAPPVEDRVGQLVRRVGGRAEISAERTARHRALARAHWEGRVRTLRRHRRVKLGLATAAVLAAALGVAWFLRPEPLRTLPPRVSDAVDAGASRTGPPPGEPGPLRQTAGRPRVIAGAVQVHREAAEALNARDGDLVPEHGWLQTGPERRAALRLVSGHDVRLDVNTRMQVIGESTVTLEHGAVYVDSYPAAAGVSLEVRTELGLVRDVGTRFEARLANGSLRVRVREGVVSVTRGGHTYETHAGAELTLNAVGGVEHRTVPVYGPEWQWSLEIAPAFQIEGRTLRELLGWALRETGWRLRFSDPAVATATASVVLSGSIDGLTPADALAAVLPTSSLHHRVVDGVLIIEPVPVRGTSTSGGPR